MLHPLPTKTRVSFDIPALLKELAGGKTFDTDAKHEDLTVIRDYLLVRKSSWRLSQRAIRKDGKTVGYTLSLKERKIVPSVQRR